MNTDGIEIKFLGNCIEVGEYLIDILAWGYEDESGVYFHVYNNINSDVKEIDTSLKDAVQYCINLQKGEA